MVKALIPKRQKLGHTVHNSTVDKASTTSAYLSQVVKSSNNSGAELFFLDNYTDRKRYMETGADKLAEALATAIGK